MLSISQSLAVVKASNPLGVNKMEPLKLKIQAATATVPPTTATVVAPPADVKQGEVVTHPLMDEIQNQIDLIIETCNDETEDAEDVLLTVMTLVEHLEEQLRKRGIVR